MFGASLIGMNKSPFLSSKKLSLIEEKAGLFF